MGHDPNEIWTAPMMAEQRGHPLWPWSPPKYEVPLILPPTACV